MIIIDPFVVLLRYVVPFFEVDTLQEWDRNVTSLDLTSIRVDNRAVS